MARYYVSKEAKCPFYKCEDGKILMCEGVCQSQVYLKQEFKTESSMKVYRQKTCGENWQECELAKVLWKKYT